MARIKWVVQRLENWAIWASRGGAGGSGFASRSVLSDWTSDVWDRKSYNGAAIPAFEEEALETDKAITALKATRPQLVNALCHIYIFDSGVVQAARKEGCAVSTMHARLEQADLAIVMWLEAQALEKRQKREAQAAQRSFTG